TSIMFTYLALSLTAWLVKGPIRDRALVAPQTASIPRELRLPSLGDTRLHLGIVAALALVLLVHLVLRYTVLGFELSVVGANVRAARHGLIRVPSYQAGAFALSGAVAGLAGVNDVLSTKGTFQAEWNPGYGLVAFAAVFLARKSPIALVPAALFLGFLAYGADIMPRAAGIAPAFFDAFEGLLLIALALTSWLHARVTSGNAA
ncbi:MAG: ABC transporter permease, partial [Chloroflexia bacterium]|nr:ABC transporter permease [Chloroflexia bacterium]